jgi:hypothetical protein
MKEKSIRSSRHIPSFNKIVQRIVLIIVFTALMGFLLLSDVSPGVDVQIGQPTPRTIKAPRSIEFEDVKSTEQERNKAELEVPPVYIYDSNAVDNSLSKVSELFYKIYQVRAMEDLTIDEKLVRAKSSIEDAFSDNFLLFLLSAEMEKIKRVETKSMELIRLGMGGLVKDNEVTNLQNELIEQLNESPEYINYLPHISEIVKKYITSTAMYDEGETTAARKAARAAVQPVTISIKKDQTIIMDGAIVDARTMLILDNLGLLSRKYDWLRAIGVGVVLISSVIMLAMFIRKFSPEIYDRPAWLLLIAMLLFLFSLLTKFISFLVDIQAPFYGFLIPMAAVGMVITILFDARVAIMSVLFASVITAIATNFNYVYMISGLLGGIFSSFVVTRASVRSDVVKSGFIIAGILAALTAALTISGNNFLTVIFYSSMSLVNGIACSIITIGVLPFLENIFGVTTSMRLLELSSPNNPLLKRLLMEAPGTYNHSLVVGNIAESAADAIGANSLLIRVASYYHDIGKTKRPYFFSENQIGENIHDDINPGLSRIIIINHLKDGVEMAQKSRLPKQIIDLISQHHGSSIISYFYHRQKKMDYRNVITEQTFRYPAKKPQSKEAAILMLADAVEATARSVALQSPSHIEHMIKNIVYDKLADGQLDECDLTLKELNNIMSAFNQILIGIYHSRVEYPEKVVKPGELKILNGSSNK